MIAVISHMVFTSCIWVAHYFKSWVSFIISWFIWQQRQPKVNYIVDWWMNCFLLRCSVYKFLLKHKKKIIKGSTENAKIAVLMFCQKVCVSETSIQVSCQTVSPWPVHTLKVPYFIVFHQFHTAVRGLTTLYPKCIAPNPSVVLNLKKKSLKWALLRAGCFCVCTFKC